MLPFPKKLLSTDVSVDPNHSQSISSRSSDSRMKLLTIPVPGAAFVTTSTFPKNMYFSLLIVGASVATLIVNSAPFAPYDILVPSANDQSELAPVVKSVFRVVPRAGSEGHVVFVRGLQSVKVWALATRSPANSRAAAERAVECIVCLRLY